MWRYKVVQNVIKQISRIKVDAIYGKKKHFNASSRLRSYHNIITIIIIILNVIMGSTLIYILCDDAGFIEKLIPLILVIITSILTTINEWAKFNNNATGHNAIGNKYLSLAKKADNFIACINDGVEMDVAEQLLKLQEINDDINILTEAYPTNNKDYSKAQEGIKNGEENYTEDELKLL